jgi:hypothetical protein
MSDFNESTPGEQTDKGFYLEGTTDANATENYDSEFSLLFFKHHGLVLASLESLRKQAESYEDVSLAWSISVMQEILFACKTSPETIKVLHNIIAKRLALGPYSFNPTPDALLAHAIFSDDLTEVDL